ncbi:EscU/YscU/HrcU family type III secretion system export apparatus switch protein, partial [Aminipila sp.]|uniref:EscU/YscU/HrcU family type III secretion system export apparatus switch protein n=1 Tax=Aminipila sp. TaxID=2060095 RepID=UPI00289938D7
MSQSKTEKATPKKRKDERKKGNVPQSKDVTSVISLLVIFSVLKLIFPYIYGATERFIAFIMGE